MTWLAPYLFRLWHETDFNCWTLVCMVYKEKLGITLPEYASTSALDINAISDEMEEGLPKDWIPADSKTPFALVTMGKAGRVYHVGVVLEPGKVFHVVQGNRAKLETLAQLAQAGFTTINFYSYAQDRHR